MVLKGLANEQALHRWIELVPQYLHITEHPEDLVVRRCGWIVELQTLRIAALLFTVQRPGMLHSAYVEKDGSLVTLLELAVKLGCTL